MKRTERDIDYYNDIAAKPYIGAIVLLGIFMVLGILGNVHVLYVYSYRMKATSHRIFIIVLAVLDLLSCSVSIPFIIADMLLQLKFTATTGCKILRFFLYLFAGSSGLLFLPIAVDRYLKTCRPFGTQINPYRAKLLCELILSISTASFWPAPVLYGHNTVIINHNNITGVSCYLDDSFKGTLYLASWNMFMTVIISGVFFGLITLYYLIGKTIRLHFVLRNKLLQQDKSNKVTSRALSRPRRHLSQKNQSCDKQNGRNCRQDNKNNEMNVYTIYGGHFEIDRFSPEISIGQNNDKISEEIKDVFDGEKNSAIYFPDINIADTVRQNKNNFVKDDRKAANEDEEKHGKNLCKSDVEPIDKTYVYILTKLINDNGKDKVNNDTGTGASGKNCKSISRNQREACRHIKRTNRTTQMFFAITILYFFTFIPHLILQLLTTTQVNFVEGLSFVWQTVYHIVFNFAFLNSMVNCYVYGFFDTLFRKELKGIYAGKFGIGRNGQNVDSSTA